MAAAAESMVSDCSGIASDRNKAVAFALFKFLSLDPNKFPSESIRSFDIAGLFSSIVQLSERKRPSNEDEVLCASNQDHMVVEPLLPPEGALLGERISFLGNELRSKTCNLQKLLFSLDTFWLPFGRIYQGYRILLVSLVLLMYRTLDLFYELEPMFGFNPISFIREANFRWLNMTNPDKFSKYDGKPEDVLNPKKKQLEKITHHLYTDDKGVATFKGIPFMTSAGPCTSSIPKANVK